MSRTVISSISPLREWICAIVLNGFIFCTPPDIFRIAYLLSYLHDFGHDLFFCLADTREYKQVSICAEQPAESIIEDKGDVLILVLTRPVDGKYRCQDCFYFFGVFHDGYKTSLISMEI